LGRDATSERGEVCVRLRNPLSVEIVGHDLARNIIQGVSESADVTVCNLRRRENPCSMSDGASRCPSRTIERPFIISVVSLSNPSLACWEPARFEI
jgi:hypothetical protein